jgi:hypothetical protein
VVFPIFDGVAFHYLWYTRINLYWHHVVENLVKTNPHTPLFVDSKNPLDFYFSKWIEIAHAHIPPL